MAFLLAHHARVLFCSFTYGMTVVQVYDNGNVFSPSVLDVSEQQLVDTFLGAGKAIACISLATNFPTLASVMHSLVNAYKKNVLPVSIGTDYTFWGSEKTKEILENPEAFAAAAASAAPAAAAADAPAAEAPKEEEKEESDDDMVSALLHLSRRACTK